jgi:predicted lipoprotein with Yx(FWY)xxD motif
MWSTARLVVTVLILSLGVISGTASAQYSAPPAPSTAPATPAAPPAAAPAAAPVALPYMLNTRWAVVDGKSELVLTDANGMTLYYFTPDSATVSRCAGACARLWPAFMEPGVWATPPNLLGRLDVVEDIHGHQVSYNGHLLYRYAKDTAPGQTGGEGVAGKWFVATPDLSWQQ